MSRVASVGIQVVADAQGGPGLLGGQRLEQVGLWVQGARGGLASMLLIRERPVSSPPVSSAGNMATPSSRSSILVMPWSLRAGAQVRAPGGSGPHSSVSALPMRRMRARGMG